MNNSDKMGLLDPSQYTTLLSTVILEARTSRDGRKFWQGHVATDKNEQYIYTYTTYCQSTGDLDTASMYGVDWQTLQGSQISKITVSSPTLIEGKNIGKANETTPLQQAKFEIQSTYKKQEDKGYYMLGRPSDKDNALTLPMLAYSFKDRAHTVTFPLTLQPKYDGVRCLSDGTKMWSRKGKLFDPKIVGHFFGVKTKPTLSAGKQVTLSDLWGMEDASQEVLSCLDTLGYESDGELILPAPYPLQDTLSAAKKLSDLSPKLLYRIYDVVIEDMSYPERYEIAKKIVAASNHPNIILAPVREVESEEEMLPIHEQNVLDGWEGTMIRVHKDLKGKKNGYKIGQRDQSLLKMKDFLEEEFLVVGLEEGKGKFLGAAIFVCETNGGKRFNTMPIGDMEQRKEYFKNPQSVIGTRWTVRFQAYTKDMIPQFGRAICERIEDIQG